MWTVVVRNLYVDTIGVAKQWDDRSTVYSNFMHTSSISSCAAPIFSKMEKSTDYTIMCCLLVESTSLAFAFHFIHYKVECE